MAARKSPPKAPEAAFDEDSLRTTRVKVTAGKDRGKTGKVLRVEPVKERLYVEGLNMVKRAVRPPEAESPRRQSGNEGQLGGVIEREGPIHVSNVILLDPKGANRRACGSSARTVARARGQEHRRESSTDGCDDARDAPPARLKIRYLEEIRPCADRALRLLLCDAGAEAREDHAEHGRRPGQAGLENAEGRPPSSSRRSPASNRACAVRASRSRPSNCARACRSAWP